MKHYMILIGFTLFLMLLVAQVAHAQGPVTPPPPPVTTPETPPLTAKQIDAAYADAAKYQAAANSLVNGMQASIDQANSSLATANASLSAAYNSLYSAQTSIAQYQVMLQQSEAARVAAQNGQIQQSIEAARAAQLSGAQAISLATDAGRSALTSIQQANQAARDVLQLRSDLTTAAARNANLMSEVARLNQTVAQMDKESTALGTALVMERQRSDVITRVAIGLFLLVIVLASYIGLVLWKLAKSLRPAGKDRMVVVDDIGQVKAMIEGLS